MNLLIAGDIDKGNKSTFLMKEIQCLKLDKNITLLGHVNNMKNLYEEVDIVVLPSWREGLSRALIEAASMQKPIITTDVPGCRDAISINKSGFLIPVKDSKTLAQKVNLLLENPKLSSKMGIIGDIVGSGKTLSILGLISNSKGTPLNIKKFLPME